MLDIICSPCFVTFQRKMNLLSLCQIVLALCICKMTDANQDTLKVDLLSTMPTQNQDQKQVDNVDNEQSRHIDECADTSFGV